MGFIRRYDSVIYGNYKRAALLYGASIGLVMALYMLVCFLSAAPILSPENYGTDALLLIGIFFFSFRYRKKLPDGRISLKELLLLGICTGIVASIVYALLLWLLLVAFFPDWVLAFQQARINLMQSDSIDVETAKNILLIKNYGAADWAFIGGFRSFVMSIIIALFSSIVFATEKGEVRQKKIKKE